MSILKPPVDPRLAPLFALRDVIPLPAHDTEERNERKILHRVKEGVRDEHNLHRHDLKERVL
jgi:hypothetical protein